jgi:hypothetical protein
MHVCVCGEDHGLHAYPIQQVVVDRTWHAMHRYRGLHARAHNARMPQTGLRRRADGWLSLPFFLCRLLQGGVVTQLYCKLN